MSTADDAWQEFKDAHPETEWTNEILLKAPFMAGYRRALEDAAKVIQVDAGPLAKQAVGGEFIVECAVKAYRNGLLEMAAGVGTKDGDDECGCDSTAGICCHDSDHCYCVEEGHTE